MYEKLLTPRANPICLPSDLAAFGRFDCPPQYDSASPPNVTADWLLLEQFIDAATDQIEQMAAVATTTQQWLLTFDFFPGTRDPRVYYDYLLYSFDWIPFDWFGVWTKDSIEVLRRPLLDASDETTAVLYGTDVASPPAVVESSVPGFGPPVVEYVDNNGDLQTVDPTSYEVFTDKITLLPGNNWPGISAGPPDSLTWTARTQDCIRVTHWAGYGDTADTVPPRLILATKFLANWWYENRLAVGTEPSVEVKMTLTSLLKPFLLARVPR